MHIYIYIYIYIYVCVCVQGVVEGKVGVVVVKPECGGGGEDIDGKEGSVVGFGEEGIGGCRGGKAGAGAVTSINGLITSIQLLEDNKPMIITKPKMKKKLQQYPIIIPFLRIDRYFFLFKD
jgi:hypothetical protein